MVRNSRNINKNPECSRATELLANDHPDHKNPDIRQIPLNPPLENLTPAERELQRHMLNMESILCDVIHENTRLQSHVVELSYRRNTLAIMRLLLEKLLLFLSIII